MQLRHTFTILLASAVALAATVDATAATDAATSQAWAHVGPWLVSPLGRVVVALVLFALVAVLKRASESIRDAHPLAKLSGVLAAAASTGLVAALQGAEAADVAAAMPQYAGGAVLVRELVRAVELVLLERTPPVPQPITPEPEKTATTCQGCGR